MKDMTDQELTDKIRQVFDDFEDHSAAEGWKELRKKYPAGQRRPLTLWWASAAALVLLACGLWFFRTGEIPVDEHLADIQQANPEPIPVQPDTPAPAVTPLPLSRSNTRAAEVAQSESGISATADDTRLVIEATDDSGQPGYVVVESREIGKPQAVSIDSLPAEPSQVFAAEHPSTPATVPGDEKIAAVPVPDRALVFPSPAEQVYTPTNAAEPADKDEDTGELLSLYAGSFFNYAEGSEATLNFGAGITSDIRLGKKLRLTTGISLAKNTLSYEGDLPASAERAANAVLLNSPGSGLPGKMSNLTTITDYDASLLSLNIPVNLKYMLAEADNKMYLSAGLISGTYLTETYAFNYRNYSTLSGQYVSESQGGEIRKQMQSFDLARALHLSFGYSTRISGNQHITIEPFVEYPLGGLGSENLRFGSSGINLKLNFRP